MMKKLIVLLFTVLMVSTPLQLLAEENNNKVLDLNAKSVILIERNTGEILYEENSDQQLPPASMTKMMTMLLIAEALDHGKISLTETVRVSEHAASMGGSQIFLEPNEEMTVEELLKAVAIGSANDASVALAEHIAGSEQAFITMMNEKATELGLEQTMFKNTTGLPEQDHYSSAYDMAMIARALLKYDFITDYTSIYEDYLRKDSDNEFWLVNTNRLIKFYPGVDGLKTGFTQEAKYCLTATALKNDMRLIAVVMGADTPKERNASITKLLDFGFSQFSHHLLHEGHEQVTEMDIIKGNKSTVPLITQDAVSILTKKGENLEQLETEIILKENVVAPIEAGEVLGSLKVYLDGEIVNEVDLITEESVDRASFLKLIKDSTKQLLEIGKP
ncbi:D-alanyl-D-alanine carboxypeptidase family protein [Amphibacillus sediminis]|uniref:D-alanyl-D-alanine carboxypeptidase family protein n=1 Tax=Amphibacillus sediminis TaxID=360185 RepID=UPI00082C0244|nr:D-alanyl-D-alanine carboxypeptidase family protein [Amphibacillus sediminis]